MCAKCKELFVCVQEFGVVVHPEKSVLTPSRQITYLGFIINSENMTVAATDEKKQKFMKTATKLLTAGFTL